MSEYGIDRPPEQEINSARANTHANDKWAQEGTRGPKGKVGGATARPADLLVGRHGPWAPPPQLRHVAPSCCLLRSVCPRSAADDAPPWPWLPPINTRGGGRERTHTHHTLSTQLSPLELEAFILDA